MKRALIACLFAASCAAQGERPDEFQPLQARAKSVCEVLADPQAYVGRRITITGIYFAEPHQRLLVDDDCPDGSLPTSHSKADGNPRAERLVERYRKRHATVRIPVVYSAILTGKSIIAGCSSPSCYRYALEEARLLAAAPPR
jgi:hypothetical protein